MSDFYKYVVLAGGSLGLALMCAGESLVQDHQYDNPWAETFYAFGTFLSATIFVRMLVGAIGEIVQGRPGREGEEK